MSGEIRRFKRYPAYKDSGVEWLGEIPAHWGVKKWRYCCQVTEGQVAPDDARYRERIMIAPNHIESGTGRILFTETADEQGAISGKYVVRVGDIIYSKIRPALNKACIATGDWLCSADMYPLRITARDLYAPYLLYFILSEPFVRLMVDESMRVAMPKVNRDKLAGTPLLLPPLSEQRTIVRHLDSETRTIDALVAKKERLIELLQEKRSALITRAVTTGFKPNVTMLSTGNAIFPAIPEGWQLRKLRHLIRQVKRPVRVEPEQDYREIGLRSWGKGVFHKDPLRGSLLEDKSVFFVEPGDLVLNIVFAWEGAVAVVSNRETGMIASHRFPTFRKIEEVDFDYLLMFLQSEHGRSLMGINSPGAAGRNRTIRLAQFLDEEIPLPPAVEQREIVQTFRTHEKRLQSLHMKIVEAVDRLKEMRATLISTAVTGKIDVREEIA